MKIGQNKYVSAKLIGSLLLLGSLFSCKEPSFYQESRINGVTRIPVIDPYEIESFDAGNSWFIELKDEKFRLEYFTSQISDPESIGISQPFFVLFVSQEFIPKLTKDKDQVWFVVNASTKRVMAFSSTESYHRALDSLGIEDIKLYDVEEVFREFDRTGSLPPEWPKDNE